MSKVSLTHIADRVLNRPLMILPEKLSLIASVLDGRIGLDTSGLTVDAEALAGRDGPEASQFVGSREPVDPNDPRSPPKEYRTTKDGVAVVPVLGSLVNRYSWIDAASGVTSYEKFKHVLGQIGADAAVNGGSVRSAILDIDSPGGEAVGAFEAADAVRALAQIMPVTAVVNGMAASAAYAIASAATTIVTTPSGISGSIGVVMMHADYSHRMHEAGVKPTLIHAGDYKVDGNPWQALTEDVKGRLKAEIERFNDLFVETVAKGRTGLTPEAIRALKAATFMGADAVALGLADSVGSFETALLGLSSAPLARSPSLRKATRMPPEAADTPVITQAMVDTARTEGHAAGLAAGTEAGKAEGFAAGASAERGRIKAILTGDAAKGREASAQHLAFATEMSAEAAVGALSGLVSASSLEARAGAAPVVHSGGDHTAPQAGRPAQEGAASWDSVVSGVNAHLGLKR